MYAWLFVLTYLFRYGVYLLFLCYVLTRHVVCLLHSDTRSLSSVSCIRHNSREAVLELRQRVLRSERDNEGNRRTEGKCYAA